MLSQLGVSIYKDHSATSSIEILRNEQVKLTLENQLLKEKLERTLQIQAMQLQKQKEDLLELNIRKD